MPTIRAVPATATAVCTDTIRKDQKLSYVMRDGKQLTYGDLDRMKAADLVDCKLDISGCNVVVILLAIEGPRIRREISKETRYTCVPGGEVNGRRLYTCFAVNYDPEAKANDVLMAILLSLSISPMA